MKTATPEKLEDKPSCFVIQAFDGSKYDRRYRETIRPALLKANVDPQRADEILGLNPVIEKIETAIKSAAICVAEVSEDNPNVWLELGYALALNRPTVILCDKSVRDKLPFDVQHRPIIFYRTDSRSGFDELEASIIKLVTHEIANDRRIEQVPTLKPGSESSTDLEAYEVAILATAFAFWPTPTGSISHWDLEKKLKAEKYTDVGLALGLVNLLGKGYLLERIVMEEDQNYGSYELKHYQVTPDGIAWIQSHKHLLNIKTETAKSSADFDTDDIPF
jgi:hypothetical protein